MKRSLVVGWILLFAGAICAFASSSNVAMGIDVKGNEIVKSREILDRLTMKIGDKINSDLIQSQVNEIYMMGFFSDVGARVEDLPAGKKVIFEVLENSIVKKIELKGNTVFFDKTLKEIMRTTEGGVFNIPLLNQDVKKITEHYVDKGFQFSGVTNLDVQEQGEKIVIEITECKLEDIEITGNKKTKEWLIERYLYLKPGMIFNSEVLVASMKNLFNLGFFETVNPNYRPGKEPGTIVVTVDVKEQKTGTASLGGGYSSTNGLVGYVEVKQKNFNGRGQTINAKVEVGGVTMYELGYADPFFSKNLGLAAEVHKTKNERDEYNIFGTVLGIYETDTTGYSVGLSRRTGRSTSTSIRFKDDTVDLRELTNYDSSFDELLTDGSGGTTSTYHDEFQSIELSVSKDTRNNYKFATAGRKDSMVIETTGGYMKGNNSYTKYMPTLQRYFGLNPEQNFGFALRVAGGWTDLRSGILPYYENYWVGGANSLRGYEVRQWSGDKMLYANGEFRYKFNDNFTGTMFMDYGDAWGLGGKNSFDGHYGYGVGIRFNTPLGPIRLDYGWPETGKGRSYFSMGQAF